MQRSHFFVILVEEKNFRYDFILPFCILYLIKYNKLLLNYKKIIFKSYYQGNKICFTFELKVHLKIRLFDDALIIIYIHLMPWF